MESSGESWGTKGPPPHVPGLNFLFFMHFFEKKWPKNKSRLDLPSEKSVFLI